MIRRSHRAARPKPYTKNAGWTGASSGARRQRRVKGEGRVSKAAGGRVRSMYRARGVCDGPCANRARDEVVAKTTAADFFADVSPRSSLLYSPSWFFNS